MVSGMDNAMEKEKTLTVSELRKLLEGVDGDVEVFVYENPGGCAIEAQKAYLSDGVFVIEGDNCGT